MYNVLCVYVYNINIHKLYTLYVILTVIRYNLNTIFLQCYTMGGKETFISLRQGHCFRFYFTEFYDLY